MHSFQNREKSVGNMKDIATIALQTTCVLGMFAVVVNRNGRLRLHFMLLLQSSSSFGVQCPKDDYKSSVPLASEQLLNEVQH